MVLGSDRLWETAFRGLMDPKLLVERYQYLSRKRREIEGKMAALAEMQQVLGVELDDVNDQRAMLWLQLDRQALLDRDDIREYLGDATKPPGIKRVRAEQVDRDLMRYLANQDGREWRVRDILTHKNAMRLGHMSDSGVRAAINRAIERGELEKTGGWGIVRVSDRGKESYGLDAEADLEEQDMDLAEKEAMEKEKARPPF